MQTAALLGGVVALTILGDYCIKRASDAPDGLTTPLFLVGALLYALPAVGWFVLMQSHGLATLGVIYSCTTLVLLALMGAALFGETLSARDLLGLGLALAAVLVMAGPGA